MRDVALADGEVIRGRRRRHRDGAVVDPGGALPPAGLGLRRTVSCFGYEPIPLSLVYLKNLLFRHNGQEHLVEVVERIHSLVREAHIDRMEPPIAFVEDIFSHVPLVAQHDDLGV